MKLLICRLFICLFLSSHLVSCASNSLIAAKDTTSGVIVGAGAGAITGAQLTSATGPGAAVGAGFGAIAGGIQGMLRQAMNEDLEELSTRLLEEKEVATAHQLLLEHYERRIAYHPSRDIYPADYFFDADSSKLSARGQVLLKELARLNKKRFPWSRLVVAVYSKSVDPKTSYYGRTLSIDRAREIGNYFVKYGIEPRRIETRPMLVKNAILVVPDDDPRRFSQAIELIAVDK